MCVSVGINLLPRAIPGSILDSELSLLLCSSRSFFVLRRSKKNKQMTNIVEASRNHKRENRVSPTFCILGLRPQSARTCPCRGGWRSHEMSQKQIEQRQRQLANKRTFHTSERSRHKNVVATHSREIVKKRQKSVWQVLHGLL